MSIVIRVDQEVYAEVMRIKVKLEGERGRPVSMNDALHEALALAAELEGPDDQRYGTGR